MELRSALLRASSGSTGRAARSVVAVVDEMDALLSGDQAVLYDLFHLTQV